MIFWLGSQTNTGIHKNLHPSFGQQQGRSTHNGLYGHGHIVFLVNHTSICKPHPFQLRVRDSVFATSEATSVRFLAEKNAPKFIFSLTNPLTSISGRDLSENQASIQLLFSERLVQTMAVVTLFTSRPHAQRYLLERCKDWVCQWVWFSWPYRLKFSSYGPDQCTKRSKITAYRLQYTRHNAIASNKHSASYARYWQWTFTSKSLRVSVASMCINCTEISIELNMIFFSCAWSKLRMLIKLLNHLTIATY